MVQLVPSPSKKRIALINIVGIINMWQKMLGACFEGYIVSNYGFVDVLGSWFKYIHSRST
jgi:uncharacterized membrane protein YwaF